MAPVVSALEEAVSPQVESCAGVDCSAPATETVLDRPRCDNHANAIRMAAARWKNMPISDADRAILDDPRGKPHLLSSTEQVINASRAGRAELPPPLGGALGFTAWSWRAKQADPGTSHEYERIWAARRPWRWHRWAFLTARRRPKRLDDRRLFWMVIKNIERGNLIKWEQADGGAFYAAPDGGYSYELNGQRSPFPRPAEGLHEAG